MSSQRLGSATPAVAALRSSAWLGVVSAVVFAVADRFGIRGPGWSIISCLLENCPIILTPWARLILMSSQFEFCRPAGS